MTKRFILALAVLILLIPAVSCAKGAGLRQPAEQADDSEPVAVTDHLGRTIQLSKTPERLVSGYYISTSALIALGLKDKIAGIEAMADTRPIYALAAPGLLELPSVGTAKKFDLEACISLKPDLVVLPVKLEDQIKTLEETGITVIGVNPENQQLLSEMIVMIAELTRSEGHKELTEYYKQKEEELKEIRDKAADKPKVYLAGNSSMLSTASANMYQNDLIEAAGGVNAAADIDDAYWAKISYEQLNHYNPDYIIIASDAVYTVDDVLNDSSIAGVSAVANKNVYKMPGDFEAWDSPVPSGILGKLWLSSILHEDIYSYDRFAEEVHYFYKKFYGFEIDKKVLMQHEYRR